MRCFLSGPNQAQCLGMVHLNGRVGGSGKLRFAGDVDGDEQRLRIIGGKRDFELAKGKIRLRGLGGERTRFRFELRPSLPSPTPAPRSRQRLGRGGAPRTD